MRLTDETGNKYGRLTVVSREEAPPRRQARWRCKCDCGGETIAQGYDLRSGNTKSCGCLRREVLAESRDQTTHGQTGSPIYRSWRAMHSRCGRPQNQNYKYYGGRGIKVCDRWMDFATFMADMGPKPTPKHSIDRINANGNYEPSNCRWATAVEQRNNRREMS